MRIDQQKQGNMYFATADHSCSHALEERCCWVRCPVPENGGFNPMLATCSNPDVCTPYMATRGECVWRLARRKLYLQETGFLILYMRIYHLLVFKVVWGDVSFLLMRSISLMNYKWIYCICSNSESSYPGYIITGMLGHKRTRIRLRSWKPWATWTGKKQYCSIGTLVHRMTYCFVALLYNPR